MQKTEETARFVATDDNGGTHTIVEHASFTLFRPLSGAEQWIRGAKGYETASGAPVNKIDDKTFELVMSGKKVRIN